ncbi:MAG: AEC family transporter [Candidatus Sumerlaeaceae bacterium]|nr:AEC family transporter [Candidatus Sumerlaeaceae bacterium]
MTTIFAVGAFGFLAVKRGLLTPNGVSELARVLVAFFLPGTLFNAMYSQYSPDKGPYMIMAVGTQIAFFVGGAVLAFGAHRLLKVQSAVGTVAALSSLQNNIYLPLPIAMAILASPAEQARAQFYIGSFVLAFTPLLWSVGVILLKERRDVGVPIIKMLGNALNPPFIAAVAGVIVKHISLKYGWGMPTVATGILKLCSDATVPMAMLVLGGIMAEVKWSHDFEVKAVLTVGIIKLLVIPAAALAFIRFNGGLDPIFGFVMLLEAASPPATNISLAARTFGGKTSLIALTLFITYLISMLTLPLWLAVR